MKRPHCRELAASLPRWESTRATTLVQFASWRVGQSVVRALCSKQRASSSHELPGSAPGRIRTSDLRIRRPHSLSAVLNRKIAGHSRATRRELSVVRSDTSASRGRQPGSRACAPQGSGGMRPSAARRRMRASNMSAVSTHSAKPAWRAAIVLLTNGERPVSAITTSA